MPDARSRGGKQLRGELGKQLFTNSNGVQGTEQLLHGGCSEPGITTGVHAPKRRQVRGNIQRQSMDAAPMPNTQTQRRNLGPANIHPRCIRTTLGVDPPVRQGVDHRLFQTLDQAPDPEPQSRQIQQRVDEQLTRTVPGHLSAAINRNHRGRSGIKKMFRTAIPALSEHGGRIDTPEFVRPGRVALPRLKLHCLPDGHVGLRPQQSHNGPGDTRAGHRIMRTRSQRPRA